MRKILLHTTILPAFLLFTAGMSLSYFGMWIHLGGRWLWREHDKYLDWFHFHLCGPECSHMGKCDE